MNQKTKGILCILLSAFCFAWMNAFVRLAGDIPSIQKSFFRNFVAAIVALILLKKSGTPLKWKKGNLHFLLLRSICGTIGILANFYAVDHLVLSDASMLNKMSPFFAIVFSYFFLKEKCTPIQVFGVAGAFIGSLFIIKPTFSNMDLLPSLIGFLGGMAAGAAYTTVRHLGQKGEKGPFIVFSPHFPVLSRCHISCFTITIWNFGSLAIFCLQESQPPEDSLALPLLIVMHRPKKSLSMTIHRFFFRHFWDSSCSPRFRMDSVFWDM